MPVRKRRVSGATGNRGGLPVRAKAASAGKPKKATVKAGIRIFVSYSHKDAAAQQQLRTHLVILERDGVGIWFDGDLDAGDALTPGISRELRRADIFVALFSPDYLASHYCWDIEYKRAMNRRARGTMRVVAVVVRPCAWLCTRAANFKVLPADGRPVTKWRSADDAYLDAAQGISGVVKTLRKGVVGSPPPKPAGKPRSKVLKKAEPTPGKAKPSPKKPKPS